jgi:hypothetical protein
VELRAGGARRVTADATAGQDAGGSFLERLGFAPDAAGAALVRDLHPAQ